MSDELAIQQQAPSVALMLSDTLRTIQKGDVTTQHVDVLKGMMDLYERNEKRQAEKDFASALVKLQGATIRVVATKKVDEKADGTCRYKFAPYEEIMRVVQPILTAHGFSITFDTEIAADSSRLTSVCTLTHSGGHSRSNKFAVRIGKPPGSSDAQGDMSTKSYAKRGALCDALNITIDHDDDARALGGPITQAQADELRRMVKESKADEARFLVFAKAESFEAIDSSLLDALVEKLEKKMPKAAPAPTKLDPQNAKGEFEWKPE